MQVAPRVVRIVSSYLFLGCAACSSAPPAPAAAPALPPATASAPAASAEPMPLPTLPSPTLAAPAGAQLAFSLDAKGAQIYACQAEAGGFAWALKAPDATLSDRRGQIVVKHYAGPTWEWVADGSKVQGSKLQAFSDDPTAIPELLLKVNKHE
ncbi:MAG TPA: DUF3455 domain-containing protein, partial [Polyangiaceae bacterium]|nr:DUF3455 domain-containing protein [Polyangiaceae bacterium]